MAIDEGLDARIEKGEALLAELAGVPLCQGRRQGDVERPELHDVRNFLVLFWAWDKENKSLVTELFAHEPEYLALYTDVEQPDRQLAMTDFRRMRDPLRSALMAKLDALRVLRHLSPRAALPKPVAVLAPAAPRVFIGHGRSLQWRALKDFVHESLGVAYEEFDRSPAAGMAVQERLEEMLDGCSMALLVMTAEDEHADGSHHARENVVHEIGLFQGRLGFRRAIVLIEEGCTPFSNLAGLVQVRFPKNDLRARFEDVRGVLAREGVLGPTVAGRSSAA